jgi:exosortase
MTAWKRRAQGQPSRQLSSCSMVAMSQPVNSRDIPGATGSESRSGYYFAVWVLIATGLFWAPLQAVIAYAAENDDASHIFLIPFLAAGVLYLDRADVFRRLSFDVFAGGALAVVGAAIALFTWRRAAESAASEKLTLYMLALVILWLAGFALFLGRGAFYKGRFALLFLFLAVPLPEFLLSRAIYWLQTGSAAIVQVLFDVADLPYLRAGFVFHTAHLNIEIAQECSGIRSSMAVLILSLLAAHFYLRSGWKQAVLVACSLVVMILKNGIRIAALTLLAIHVDPSFLFGRLHRDGGVVFFLLGLALLVPVLWLLGRGEGRELGAPADLQKTQ